MSVWITVLLAALSSWVVLIAIACLLCRAAARADADDRRPALSPLRS